jgi:transcriptional regulator with XRE-family HTH domain
VTVAERFAANLSRCREASDISQEELGFRAGLHRTEISQLERGLRVARLDTVAKLAGALEVEPATLLDGIRWTPGTLLPGHFT